MPDKKNHKKILIVESPTKVKTIKKFVGNKYKIMATKGHVKDLPKSRFGVDIENNFEPEYIIMRDKKKTLSEIKKEAKNVEEIYLATDPDREGEAICWHVSEEIKKLSNDKKIKRVLFNEITKNAVIEALKNPKDIDMNLVNAQQARRVLDRIVGYKISPLLWKAIRKGLSAGRVQSVALKLIVDRQREIDKFIPEEYWSIKVKLETEKKETFLAKLIEKDGEKINIKNEEQAKNIENELKNKPFIVIDVQKKKRLRKPVPPFITSSMQQEASKKLRFTAQKTMLIAQQLYEGINIHGEGQVGLITYMRTDSLRVSNDALKECRDFINKNFGEKYLPDNPNVYKSKKSSQDAHEAIRPTSAFRNPEDIKNDLTPDQYKLYSLIWKRFIASQMKPAEFDDTRVKIKANPYIFQANGSIQIFDGFLKVYDVSDTDEKNNNKDDNDKNILPDLKINEELNLIDIIKTQHFTQPPPQYTDATLVKALEEKDIGRPSTYAPIIGTLVNRKYVIRDKGKFAPTELGVLVSDVLTKNFSNIINEEFTAKMEDNLDKVEEGKVVWNELIKNFYKEFEETLKKAEPNFKDLKKDIEGDTGEVCELCGGKMIIKWGRHGKFLSCENYPKCKNAKPLNDKENKQHEEIIKDEKCPECGSELVIKSGPFGKFIACSNYPQCKYTKQIIVKVGVKCPECGGDIIERKMRGRRKFYGCSNYPNCKFMVWDKPVLKTCPKCGNYFLLERYKKNKVMFYCKNCDYKEEKNINDNE